MSQSNFPLVDQPTAKFVGIKPRNKDEKDLTQIALLKERARQATQMLHELGFPDLSFCVYDTKGAWLAGEYYTDKGEALLKFLDSDLRKNVLPNIFIGNIYSWGYNRSLVVAVL